jgi:hypothetical protein
LKAGPNNQNHSWKSCRGAGQKSNTLPRKWPRRTTKDRTFKPCAVKVCRWRSNERAARKRTTKNHHHHHHHHDDYDDDDNDNDDYDDYNDNYDKHNDNHGGPYDDNHGSPYDDNNY